MVYYTVAMAMLTVAIMLMAVVMPVVMLTVAIMDDHHVDVYG